MQLTHEMTVAFPTATRFSLGESSELREKIVARAFLRKRIFDFVFAALVTAFLLSWLIPLIAIISKLESKGPVFFKQLRTGKQGKPFYCIKFRSMTVSADADSKQATKEDWGGLVEQERIR